MSENKFQELLENEAFVKEMLSKETAEEVQELFADNDVDLSIDEIHRMKEMLLRQESPEEAEELSEDDLETVAGGIRGFVFLKGNFSLEFLTKW